MAGQQDDSDFSDSSDDGVSWGPYTIKEARKDIRRCIPRLIKQRHSSISRFRHFDIPKEVQDLTSDLEKSAKISKPAEEATQYFTASETEQLEKEDKSCDFLEKLSKVIDEPVSHSSSYRTAINETNLQEDENNCHQEDISIINISDDSIQEESITSENSFKYNKEERCQETSFGEDILEIDYSTEEQKLNELENISAAGLCSEDIIENNYSTEEDKMKKLEDVIANELSSEPNTCSFISGITPFDDASENSIGSTTDNVIYHPKKMLSKISEKSEYTTVLDQTPSKIKINSDEVPEIRITQPETSPVSIPDINLIQFDDSCTFDDTLEEINRFLEQGDAYVTPKKSPIKSQTTSKNLFSPISGSFMNSSSKEYAALENKAHSSEKIKKPSVEVKAPKSTAKSKFTHTESKIKPPSVNARSLAFSKTPATVSDFKIPTSKGCKKLGTTPSKIPNLSLKNVVSPVGVYINHGPKYCPMIRADKSKPLPKNHSESRSKLGSYSSKENIPSVPNMEIPPVIYRPAKIKQVSEVREVNLPGKIRKLISPQVVTKHERRIESYRCNQSVERRLEESELSIDASRDSSVDISVLTHKQPFDLRKFK